MDGFSFKIFNRYALIKDNVVTNMTLQNYDIDRDYEPYSKNVDDNDCIISYNFENKEYEGLQYSDYILATNNLNIIEIVEFKNHQI